MTRIITEPEIKEFIEARDAKIRHLKNVRTRYLDYIIKMKNPSDRVIGNAILAEKQYKQAQKERM